MDFSYFKIKKSKKGDKISLYYKRHLFITVGIDVLLNVMSDYATKDYLTKIVNIGRVAKIKPIDDKTIRKARQLERAYTTRRRKYRGNRNIKNISHKSNEFKNFIKAIQYIEAHGVNYKVFLDAQIDGLSFLNDGSGIFPSTSQLSTSKAEDRLLDYISYDTESNDPSTVKRLELSYSDKTTPLNENPTYQARYKDMKKGTAKLQHAYFVYDCQVAMKGFATDFVADYIEDLLN